MANEVIKKIRHKVADEDSISKKQIHVTDTGPVPSNIVELPVTPEALELQRQAGRVAESDASAFRGVARTRPEGGWLSTVGMFTGDADMLVISEETRKIRDRQRTA